MPVSSYFCSFFLLLLKENMIEVCFFWHHKVHLEVNNFFHNIVLNKIKHRTFLCIPVQIRGINRGGVIYSPGLHSTLSTCTVQTHRASAQLPPHFADGAPTPEVGATTYYYRPLSKASKGYVFTGICLSPLQTRPSMGTMVDVRAVRILLECILVWQKNWLEKGGAYQKHLLPRVFQ